MKKKFSLYLLCILALQVCSASGAQAGFYGAPGGAILTAVGRLEPWCASVDQKLENQVDGTKIVRKFEHRSASLVCSFSILRNGTILHPKIEKTSGVHTLDKAFLKVLKNTALDPCPNNVPIERGIFCDVTVTDGHARIFSHLNPTNRTMYFQVEYYTKSIPFYELRAGPVPARH